MMLKHRGATSFADPTADGTPAVFVDEMYYGRLPSLRQLSTAGVKSVRYLNAGEATFRFGIGYPSGAILVTYGP